MGAGTWSRQHRLYASAETIAGSPRPGHATSTAINAPTGSGASTAASAPSGRPGLAARAICPKAASSGRGRTIRHITTPERPGPHGSTPLTATTPGGRRSCPHRPTRPCAAVLLPERGLPDTRARPPATLVASMTRSWPLWAAQPDDEHYGRRHDQPAACEPVEFRDDPDAMWSWPVHYDEAPGPLISRHHSPRRGLTRHPATCHASKGCCGARPARRGGPPYTRHCTSPLNRSSPR